MTINTRIRQTGKTAFAAVAAAVALTACGGAGDRYSAAGAAQTYESAADTAYYDGGFYEAEAVAEEPEAAVEENGYDVSDDAATDLQEGVDAQAGRKLIKNVNMNVETEQFDALLPGLEQRITALGGYIEEMSSYSRNNTYSSDYPGTRYLRYASMTVRMPKENLDLFLTEVGEQSNVVSRSESVTDVTLQYVDLESHKKALITEQDRLLELMEQAENVEDIIAIEGRLSEVRYQLESMESQLRTYDNQIDYSTVYLSIDEVERYSPTEDVTTAERIRRGFVNSLWGIGRNAGDCVIWFLINLPYLIVWAIIILLVLLLVKVVRKAAVKRMAKKEKRAGRNPYGNSIQPYGLGQPGTQGGAPYGQEKPVSTQEETAKEEEAVHKEE